MAARAVILDLDGTLWDSAPWYAAGLNQLVGLDMAEVCLYLQAGGNVVHLADRHGVTSAFLRWCEAHCEQLAPYDGAVDALVDLRSRGVARGVVTNLSRKIAEPAMRVQLLSALLPAQEYAAGKPNPRGINSVLTRLDASPGDAVYVGDTATDARAAERAGVRFAWAAYGYGQQPGHRCDVILTDPSELAAL